jgi:hypothetical protein
MHDVYVFSTGQTPDVIRANEHSKKIIQNNCIHCHEDAVESIMMGAQPFDRTAGIVTAIQHTARAAFPLSPIRIRTSIRKVTKRVKVSLGGHIEEFHEKTRRMRIHEKATTLILVGIIVVLAAVWSACWCS